MIFNRIIRAPHFCSLLKLQNPSNRLKDSLFAFPISTNSSECSLRFSIFVRPISAGFTKNPEEKIQKRTEPLSVFFRRAVVAPQKSDFHAEDGIENVKLNEELIHTEEEVRNLKQKLRNLEEEIRILNKKRPEKVHKLKPSSKKVDLNERKGKRSLLSLFASEKTKEVNVVKPSDFGHENPVVHKELSPDMQMFAQHLYAHGYFKNANFVPRNKFKVTCFEDSYAREFLKFAAVSFGKDQQQIVKWLSAKDLKTVALFGCPSLGQKSVYAAKHMRRFFEIDEQKVCQSCVVKDSCEHANKRCKKASTQLYMADVNRVLIMYAMESVPQKLLVPQAIKDCVSRLLKEIVSLTQHKLPQNPII